MSHAVSESTAHLRISKGCVEAMAREFEASVAAMGDGEQTSVRDLVSTFSDVPAGVEGGTTVTQAVVLLLTKHLTKVASGMGPNEILTFSQLQERLDVLAKTEHSAALLNYLRTGETGPINVVRAAGGRCQAENSLLLYALRLPWRLLWPE